MADNKSYWVEIGLGSVSRRGEAIPFAALPNLIRDRYPSVIYQSTLYYDKTLHSHLQRRGSIADYKGKRYLPKGYPLIWDFDGDDGTLKGGLEKARNFFQLCKANDVPLDALRFWFSGNKGIHCETPNLFGLTPARTLNESVRDSMQAFAGDLVDTKPYSKSGFIRSRWSTHEKTGLLKIPLTQSDLLSATPEEIRAFSKDPKGSMRGEIVANYEPIPDEAYGYLSDVAVEHEEKEIVAKKKGGLTVDPTNNVTCMARLWNRGPREGRRNTDLHEMVRSWRGRGLTSDQAIALGRTWTARLNGQSAPFTDSEVAEVVYKVYENNYLPSCEREVYKEFCSSKCRYFKNKNVGPTISTIDDDLSSWKNRITNGGNIVLNLQHAYGQRFTIEAGEVTIIIGDTKIGKTAVCQNLAVQYNDLTWLNISTEMSKYALWTRYAQIAFDLSIDEMTGQNELQTAIEEGDLTKEEIMKKLSHISIIETGSDVDEIIRTIDDVQPDCVVIDPFEDLSISGSRGDNVRDDTEIIKRIKSCATRTGVAIFIVHHIKKAAMNQHLNAASGKGAKAIVEKPDHVLIFESKGIAKRRLRYDRGRRSQQLDVTLYGDETTFRFYRNKTQLETA